MKLGHKKVNEIAVFDCRTLLISRYCLLQIVDIVA